MNIAVHVAIVLRRRLFALAGVMILLAAHPATAAPSRSVIALDEDWRFHLGPVEAAETPAFDDTRWRRVDLPHDWSVEFPFSPTHASGTGFLPGGTGWYRKSLVVPETVQGQRVAVEFDGVYRNSDVWVNGHHLGHRPSGYTGFRYDLKPHLRLDGQSNLIAVRVQRENVADSRWYPGSGIYRHVRLVVTPPVHVAPWGVFVTTPRVSRDSANVNAQVEVANESDAPRMLHIQTQVRDGQGRTVSEAEDARNVAAGQAYTFSTWQTVPHPMRWSTATPHLYTLTTRVTSEGILLDEVQTPFGIRTFRFDPNTGFHLNDAPLLLKGVCMHHDGGVVGAAVPDEVLKRRLQLIKDLGANAVRCSHNPMAPEFYSLCDQLGLLVLDEAFDEWELGKRKWVEGRNAGTADRFGYAAEFDTWATRDLSDMIRQHRNHPSIILWSIGNEIDYPTDPYVHPESRVDRDFSGFSREGLPSVTRLSVVAPRLIATVKREDPTRPVTMALANVPAANGTGLAAMLDVAGYNYQEKEYDRDHRAFPSRVIFGSETSKRAESWIAARDRDFISGMFIWVGFDFLGEAGRWPSHGSRAGLFDRCGFPKTAAFQFESFWRDTPLIRLVSAPTPASGPPDSARSKGRPHWTWNATSSQPMTVTSYSNCDEVELLLNDRSLGRRAVTTRNVAQWELLYEAGTLVAIGFVDGQERSRDMLRTAAPPLRLIGESDTFTLTPGGVAHLVLRVVDERNVTSPHADSGVRVEVTGDGRLLGLDNGDQSDPTPLRSTMRVPREGRLLAIIQAGKSAGTFSVRASANGLEPFEASFTVE
jgi:hypothetical protein